MQIRIKTLAGPFHGQTSLASVLTILVASFAKLLHRDGILLLTEVHMEFMCISFFT